MIVSPLTIPITSAAFTAVTIPSLTRTMDALIYTADLSEFQIATDVTGADAVPVPGGQVSIPRVNSGEVLCWVKGASSVNFHVLFGRSAL